MQAARLDIQIEGHELLLPLVAVGAAAADLLVREGALEHARADLLLVDGVEILVHLTPPSLIYYHHSQFLNLLN